MRLLAFLSTLALILCQGQTMILAETGQTGPTVSLSQGNLRGTVITNGEAVFKGIPFAQPPVGDLRWRAPLPAKPWTGVRDASAFGPACVQGSAEGAHSSEDCLYLNVWTPTWPVKSPVAVMVWIYGGGNFAGAASDAIFDGKNLASHGVVLVTVNYRLGVFGFLAHPELTQESAHHVSGNYGLLDQVMALQWVHDNIAKFGGDPHNVTIFGESAGSLDINVLMTSPLTEGLFQRVIGESGPVVAPPPLAEGEKKGVDFAAKLGITGAEALPKLRALSSADLLNATGQGLAFLGPTLGVVVDGWVFPQSPMSIFAAGREHRVGLMLGSNSQELQKPFFPMAAGGLHQAITQQYGALADSALEAYGLDAATEPAPDPELGPVMAQWATDTQFRCGSVAELVWHSPANNPAYQFQFSRSAPGKKALGAPHGSEVPYVFGTLETNPSADRYNDTDRKLSEQIQKYWTTFARTGDPNDGVQTRWPKFDPEKRGYLDLMDTGPVAKEGLRRATCDVYMELLKTQLSR